MIQKLFNLIHRLGLFGKDNIGTMGRIKQAQRSMELQRKYILQQQLLISFLIANAKYETKSKK